MNLDSVRDLKQSVMAAAAKAVKPSAVSAASVAVAARSLDRPAYPRTYALGIASRKKKNDYALAVRIQHRALDGSAEIERLRKRAKGEIDVRYVGRVSKRAIPWNQKRVRPLQIGLSCGHFRVTAGTLGVFTRKGASDAPLILSNNHVLADENGGAPGDAILQQGSIDGGRQPQDVVGALLSFVALRSGVANTVDAALATLAGVQVRRAAVRGLGTLAGARTTPLEPGDAVAKLGRTTGVTRGRVTAVELDNVVVAYEIGDLRFDDQIEIEGAGAGPFSQGGDSGSLILDSEMLGAALLFAGGDQGGSNGQGLTYANPLPTVLAALGVELFV